MSLLTRTYTFTDGTTAYGSQVDSEVANIVNTLNSLDQGNTTWTNVKVTTLAPQANVSLGGHKITNLGTPTTSGDAVAYPVTHDVITASTIRGSTANSGGSAQEISQGTISTPDLRANAVTQAVTTTTGTGEASAGTTILTRTITTVGGPVLISGQATISITNTAGGAVTAEVYIQRDGTAINGAVAAQGFTGMSVAPSSTGLSFSIPMILDSQVAGSYSYTLKYIVTSGTSPLISNANLTVAELRA